jgi:glycosyltransferase involved in cell wall biosynthesis
VVKQRRQPGQDDQFEPAEARVAELLVVSYWNPDDLLGGAEQIAWAEAELLSETRRVAFASASPPVEGAPFAQYRLGAWTRRLYQPLSTRRRNPLLLGLFHLLSLFNPVVLFEALRLFGRIRPDVVHTHNLVAISPAVWLAARLRGARVMHTHHDLWLLCELNTMTDLSAGRPCGEAQLTCVGCKSLRPAKRAQLASVSIEVFPSEWLRDRLNRSGAVVPSFSTTYRSGTVESPAPHEPTFVYVGALVPHKLGVLLEAFELASAEGDPPMRLAVAGAGPLAEKVTRASEVNPRVEYLGRVDPEERDRLLSGATAAVVPSTCPEASSLVFFEALAAGIPVIASDIGGITELQAYGNLLLVPPGDAPALASALRTLLTNPGEAQMLRAKARVHRDGASPQRFAADVSRLLDEETAGG